MRGPRRASSGSTTTCSSGRRTGSDATSSSRKAVGLGIPARRFVACLDDPAARARVLSDTGAGAKLGVKSTPTLVINGRAVEGALERSRYEYVIALERRS